MFLHVIQLNAESLDVKYCQNVGFMMLFLLPKRECLFLNICWALFGSLLFEKLFTITIFEIIENPLDKNVRRN